MLYLQQMQQQPCLRRPVQLPNRLVAAAAAKKQKPKKRKAKQPVSQRIVYMEEDFDADYEDDSGPADIKFMPGTRIPKAPAPKAAAADAVLEPEQLYPVFPKQPKAVEKLPNSKRSWGPQAADRPASTAAAAAPEAQPAQPARLWNPRTGFMRTRAELEQEQQAAAAAAGGATGTPGAATPQQSATAASSSAPSSTSSFNSSSSTQPSPSSNSSSSSQQLVERLPNVSNPLQPPRLPRSALAADAAVDQAAAPGQQLPQVGRAQVLTSCALTSAAMTAAAVGLSLLAAQQSSALFGTSQEAIDRLLRLPGGLQDAQQAGVMLAAAGAVTAARVVLKQQWPDFREATDRSNEQVLSSLSWPDAAAVSVLTGVSEELLFRWGLISATWPDARGVLLSGAVFGVLHVSGGRNAAFAAWASAVGWLYGAAFLLTGNVWVPAGAHALANFASAALWLSSNAGKQAPQQDK